MSLLAVTVCTKDPSSELFARCMRALAAQTLEHRAWKVVVVDNRAAPDALEPAVFAGVPGLELLHEPVPGTGRARLRAYAAARTAGARYAVIIDDDNIPAPEYLERAVTFLEARPEVGVLGGVNTPVILGGAKAPNGPWWLPHFACPPLGAAVFSDKPYEWSAVPPGAGMVIRAKVVDRLLDYAGRDARYNFFGHHHPSLPFRIAGEDTMLIEVARRAGFAYGRIPELVQEHLLPASRFSFEAIARLVRGNHFGCELIRLLWGLTPPRRQGLQGYAHTAWYWRPDLASNMDWRVDRYFWRRAVLDAQNFWRRAGWEAFSWA